MVRARPCFFAQTVIDPSRGHVPIIVSPNPSIRSTKVRPICRGRATLPEQPAGKRLCLRLRAAFRSRMGARATVLRLLAGQPTGKVLSLDDWKTLFALSDKYGFIIASDECYSEIYFDEANRRSAACRPPNCFGRSNERLVMFSSLSKRSNVPGMRSGFVAGDAADPEEIPALPHLPRLRHGAAGQTASRWPPGTTKRTYSTTATSTARNSPPARR